MPRRSGATLLEALVAIFVMAIGLLALLTLFPLGALRMAMAITGQRCAEAGASAQAMSIMMNVRNEPGLFNPADPFMNPGQAAAANALADGPSYPVFIDPIGWANSFGTPSQTSLGGGSFIARRSVNFVTGAANARQAAYQWFTCQDDINFENSVPGSGVGFSQPGTPQLLLPPPPTSFTRDVRYSVALLCQRPRYADATVVDTAIVVYNKRSTASVAGVSLPEYSYPTTTFNNVTNTITINYNANVPPPVRAGDWELDATPMNIVAGQSTTAHGYFYRIVGVNDLGNNTTELEVETPLRGFPANSTAYAGTAIILDGVAEVFQKGPARLP
jgi:hypothetical protein